MTKEEWESHTTDWQDGYKCCQNADDVPQNYSEEFRKGYIFGLENPIGSVTIPIELKAPYSYAETEANIKARN